MSEFGSENGSLEGQAKRQGLSCPKSPKLNFFFLTDGHSDRCEVIR